MRSRLARAGAGFVLELAAIADVVRRYQHGRAVVEQGNRAAFGPSFRGDQAQYSATRTGDALRLSPAMFSEVASPRWAGRLLGTLRMALSRDGQLVIEGEGDGGIGFDAVDVPPEPAMYRLEMEATRPAEVSELPSRVTAAWTFRSEHVAGRAPLDLPLPTLRFRPLLRDDRQARRRLPLILPVAIERPTGAATPAIADVSIEASFDDGATWRPVPGVRTEDRWVGVVFHPANAAFVSLRGSAHDVEGNRVEQTVVRAYQLSPS